MRTMAMLECSACQYGNTENAKFCANCGKALARVCPSCKAAVQEGDRFCSACGAPIAGKKRPLEPAAERRPASILFCDLVGSTALSEQLDAEDLRVLIRAYHDECSRAIVRYDGHVMKYLGDGVLGAFGYPHAHEDDSQRSILAGLAILDTLKGLNQGISRQFGVQVSVRIGIHSGHVVAGEMGALDQPVVDVVGEAPNIAARVQELAPPNSVLVTADTRRLAQASFIFESLGERKLKGITREIEVFKVLATDSDRTAPTQRVVGRKDELAQLELLWKRAVRGQGRLALVRGDPGIGKSTLVNSIVERVKRDPNSLSIMLNCSPYHQNTPFHPVVEYLRTSQMHLSRDDPAETQLTRMADFVVSRGYPPAEVVPILAPLLSIPFEHRYEAPLLSAEGRRIKTVETILDMLVRRTGQFNVVLVLDNIHWADPSTLELFTRVLERLHGLRMLTLATYRSYFQPTFPRPAGTVELSLDRLDHPAVWALAKQAAGGKELPFEILDHIATKTDGVPLFVEELTKTIIESGAVQLKGKSFELVGELRDLAIPSTLQGSLLARLERAIGRKDIAQVAAVVGREFTMELVAAVAKVDQETASRQLSDLVSADLVYQVEAFTGAKAYRFRHALIQDAAYDTLLRSVRQQYHNDIAHHLESQFADTAEEQPEVIANHYSAAGTVDEALKWWALAGAHALGRSANIEAIAHFTRGLEILEQKAASPETIQMELAMLAQRGTALIATRGFAAPEVGETFRRAETICQIIGETPLLFPVIWGLWVYFHVRSELETSCGYAAHMLRLAEVSGETGMFIEGHFTMGDAQFWLGRLEESKQNLDRALELYDPKVHRVHTTLYGQDPGVSTLCYLSYTYWCLGFPDKAIEFADRAFELAETTNHPFSIGWALSFACSVRNWRKDYVEALAWAKRCRAYCTEQGQAFWSSASDASLGWAMFYGGHREEGLKLMRQGLNGYEMTGAIVVSPLWRASLADALVELGKINEAMRLVDEGLATVASHCEWVTEPYLRRVRGDILARRGKKDEALLEYELSFDKATSQSALMRALQTAVAWSKLDPSPANLSRLSQTYNKFTEGFTAPDLIEAKQLLEAAERPSPE
jgi:class 3 adenylate cyclase/tetratricopeptide (TPR) repeat protein